MTSTQSEAEPSPVFVDQSGRRGRRLRGAGWVFGAAFVGVTLAMVSGLLGTQSDAPSFAVPDTADTLPPGQYVNAPLPAPPGKAGHSKGVPRTGASATATPTGTTTATATSTATGTPTAASTGTTTPTPTSPATATPTGASTGTGTPTATSTGTATPTGASTGTGTSTDNPAAPITAP